MTIAPDIPQADQRPRRDDPWDGVTIDEAAKVPAPDPAAHLIRSDTMREYGTVEQLSALYGALATASIGFEPVVKSATVSYANVSYKYAPLSALVAATREHLGKAGLAVLQPFGMLARDGAIATTLVHKDGARLVSTIAFQAKGDIKELGGQTTYLRRYAYCALCMLDGVEDAENDGGNTLKNEPSGQGKQARRPRSQAPRPTGRPRPASARATVPEKDERPPPPGDDDAPGGTPLPAQDIDEVVTPSGPSGQPMSNEQREALKAEVGRVRIKGRELGQLTDKICGCEPGELDSGTAVDLLRALKELPDGK